MCAASRTLFPRKYFHPKIASTSTCHALLWSILWNSIISWTKVSFPNYVINRGSHGEWHFKFYCKCEVKSKYFGANSAWHWGRGISDRQKPNYVIWEWPLMETISSYRWSYYEGTSPLYASLRSFTMFTHPIWSVLVMSSDIFAQFL